LFKWSYKKTLTNI